VGEGRRAELAESGLEPVICAKSWF
jgi:hypothetical protein